MFDFDVRAGHDPAAPHAALQGWGNLPRPSVLREEFCQPIALVPRRQPVVIAPSLSLRNALEVMAERHAAVAVVASHGVLLGMLSEREVVRRLLDGQPQVGDLPVGEVMAPDLESLLETDTVDYAVRKLWSLGGRPMPIVRSNGSFWGVLETQDIVAWLCHRIAAADSSTAGHA